MQQPDPEAGAALTWILSGLRTVLREQVAGVYLYGSAVLGDYDPGLSDLDLLVVTDGDIDAARFAALDGMHRALPAAHPAGEERLDIAYVPVELLARFPDEAATMPVISPGEGFHRVAAEHWWLLNWHLVRSQGRTLYGPPPGTWIPALERETFVALVREHAAAWVGWLERIQLRRGQAYAVLTLGRALYAVRHGEQASKRRAAAWVAETYPAWAALTTDALAWRAAWREEGGVDHAATLGETRRFVQWAIVEVMTG